MADELKIALDSYAHTGLTLLGKVYASDGSQEGSTVSMSEDGPAVYIGDFPLASVGDGEYIVKFETTTKMYGTGSLYVRNNAEVTQQSFFNGALDTVATVTTNTDVTALNNLSAAQVASELATYDGPTKAELDSAISPLALESTLAVVDGIVDDILLDTSDLQTTKGERATATGFNTVAPDNSSIASILADTNELQGNQGNWLTATGFNTVAPDNTSIASILADTNELQGNQADFATATGFSTPTNITNAQNAIVAEIDDLETKAQADTRQTALISEHDATQASLSSVPTNPLLTNDARLDNLNATISSRSTFDFSSESVTTDSASRTASQADVSALSLEATSQTILEDSNELQANQTNFHTADVSSLASQSSIDAIDAIVDAILIDSNDLQTSQSNWLTATGFSTPANVSDSQGIITTAIGNLTAPDNASILAVKERTDNLPDNPASTEHVTSASQF